MQLNGDQEPLNARVSSSASAVLLLTRIGVTSAPASEQMS
jgi:hypothetical protein